MTRIRTLTGTTVLLLLSSIVLPKGDALGQTGAPWVSAFGPIKVSECKSRAENFLEAKGFQVTKVSSAGSQVTSDIFAEVEAATQELAVLVHCATSDRTSIRILVVVVKRNDSVGESTVEQLRKDVMNAVTKQ